MNISLVTFPTLRIVRSTVPSPIPLTDIGASPKVGIDTSKNCPGLTSPS